MIELSYKEIGGLLYPNIDIGEDRFNNLGKFGKARLAYLHEKHFGYYRELLIMGKLAEHCEGYDEKGYELSERLQQEYLKEHPLSDDFMEIVRIRMQARDWADEIILSQKVYG